MTTAYQSCLSEKQLPLMQLFFCLIQRKPPVERVERLLSQGDEVDWTNLIRLAGRHRTESILYANLKSTGLWKHLPAERQAFLRTRYLQITADNMRLQKNLLEVLGLLRANDIPAVPLKGPVLSQTLYGDGALRFYQDLDLLIPRQEAVKAWLLLQDNGFNPHGPQLDVSQFKAYIRYENEVGFISHENDRLALDLHWHLRVYLRHLYDFDFCRPRFKKIMFEGQEIESLSDEDTLLFLCIHGAGDIWPHLEMVLCVAEFIRACPGLDWGMVFELAKTLHCRRMLLLGLFLAGDIFEVALPQEIDERLRKDGAVKQLAVIVYERLFQGEYQADPFQKRVRELPYHLLLRAGIADKFFYLLSRIFSPRKSDLQGRLLGSRWFFLYFLLRPLRQVVELVEWVRAKF